MNKLNLTNCDGQLPRRRMGAASLVLACALLQLSSPSAFSQAFSVPVSNILVGGEVTVPGLEGEERIEFSVLEGAMLSVKSCESESFVGLTPLILDAGKGHVRFVLFEIEELGEGNQAARESDSIELMAGATGSLSMPGLGYIEIRVTEIRESTLSPDDLETYRQEMIDRAQRGEDPESACCVTCNGVTTCACRVVMSCGDCCAPGCCSGGGGGGNGNCGGLFYPDHCSPGLS